MATPVSQWVCFQDLHFAFTTTSCWVLLTLENLFCSEKEKSIWYEYEVLWELFFTIEWHLDGPCVTPFTIPSFILSSVICIQVYLILKVHALVIIFIFSSITAIQCCVVYWSPIINIYTSMNTSARFGNHGILTAITLLPPPSLPKPQSSLVCHCWGRPAEGQWKQHGRMSLIKLFSLS